MKDFLNTLLGIVVVAIGIGGTAIYMYSASSIDQGFIIGVVWLCTFIIGRASKK